MHFGPDSILLVIEVDMLDTMELMDAENTMKEIRSEIQRQEPTITKVFIQSANNLDHKLT